MNNISIEILKLNGLSLLGYTKDNSNNTDNTVYVDGIERELFESGYVISKDIRSKLSELSSESLLKLHEDIVNGLYVINNNYEPFYISFPDGVRARSEIELCINALLHYWSFGVYRPNDAEIVREKLNEKNIEFKKLDLLKGHEHSDLFYDILTNDIPLTNNDIDILKYYLSENNQVFSIDLDNKLKFQNKEKQAIYAGFLLEKEQNIEEYVQSVVDVLRIATVLSGGDVRLRNNIKFVSLPRKQRKVLIDLLEKYYKEDDIKRHKNKFIRLFHGLHIGDYSKELWNNAKKLRDGKTLDSFYGQIEKYYKEDNADKLLDLYAQRPTELLRAVNRLISYLHFDENVDKFLKIFKENINQIPQKTLLQFYGYLKYMLDDTISSKCIYFDGVLNLMNRSHKVLTHYERTKILEPLFDIVHEAIDLDYLTQYTLVKDAIPEKSPLPISIKETNSLIQPVETGTYIKKDIKNTLRFFIHWKGYVDIDLSCVILAEDYKKICYVSYTRTKNEMFEIYHSGDIVSAPEGASEYIDVDVKRLKEYDNIKYIVPLVFLYGGALKSFREIDECFFGYMERDSVNTGEIYEPKTVKDVIKIDNKKRAVIPYVFDVKNNNFIAGNICIHKKFGLYNVEYLLKDLDSTVKFLEDRYKIRPTFADFQKQEDIKKRANER